MLQSAVTRITLCATTPFKNAPDSLFRALRGMARKLCCEAGSLYIPYMITGRSPAPFARAAVSFFRNNTVDEKQGRLPMALKAQGAC